MMAVTTSHYKKPPHGSSLTDTDRIPTQTGPEAYGVFNSSPVE